MSERVRISRPGVREVVTRGLRDQEADVARGHGLAGRCVIGIEVHRQQTEAWVEGSAQRPRRINDRHSFIQSFNNPVSPSATSYRRLVAVRERAA